VLTTEACRRWWSEGEKLGQSLQSTVLEHHSKIRAKAATVGLLEEDRQFLVSVRSSPVSSMPGVLGTVINVGLDLTKDDATQARGLSEQLLRGFATSYMATTGRSTPTRESVLRGLDELHALAQFRSLEKELSLGASAGAQLIACIEAVFRSSTHVAAQGYARKRLWTEPRPIAIVVQAMVLGNRPGRSATGVLWTRDLETGLQPITGSYVRNAQGPAVVDAASRRVPLSFEDMRDSWPDTYDELSQVALKLDALFDWPQEVEFTIDAGAVWILQSRDASLSPVAATRYAVDMVESGRRSIADAIRLTPPDVIAQLRSDQLFRAPAASATTLARGLQASPGWATGPLAVKVRDTDATSLAAAPDGSILVASHLSPRDDIDLLQRFSGFVTATGGPGTHTASLLRKLHKPYLVALDCDLVLDEQTVSFGGTVVPAGDVVSIVGKEGSLVRGHLDAASDDEHLALVRRLESWSRELEYTSPWRAFTYDAETSLTPCRQAVEQTIANSHRRSDKAVVNDLLALIPPDSRIHLETYDIRDIGAIRASMYRGLGTGAWVGAKVCRPNDPRLGDGPWQTGLLNSDALEAFLADPEYEGPSGHGGYIAWSEDRDNAELVVVFDPPGKGDPSTDAEHFVCTVSCGGSAPQVQVTLLFGTWRLRSLEAAPQSDLVIITIDHDHSDETRLGVVRSSFGDRYALSQSRPGPPKDSTSTALLCEHSGRIEARFLRATEAVVSTIIHSFWRPPFDLPHYMAVIDEEYGMDTLEFQGRLDLTTGSIKYLKVFDAKGREEEVFLRAAERSS
jgi:pyruvate,orthophosphate dikinase